MPRGYPKTIKSLGDAIRKRRLDLGIHQKDAAKIIGCDPASVVNWEKGHSEPRIIHMAGVVGFLGYDPFSSNTTIAEEILSFRKARGLTQLKLARMLGVNPGTLGVWESGERIPDDGNLRTFRKIVEAMGPK